VNPTDAEVQDLLGDPEVVEAIAAGLAGELLKHKRDVTRLQAALETTTLEAREAEARADWLTGELCDARGENAALRARALPVVVWNDEKAVCGNFLLGASDHEWLIGLALNGKLYMLLEGKTGGKPACEAAFLRMVGAGNG
jgi:hypothetical protein